MGNVIIYMSWARGQSWSLFRQLGQGRTGLTRNHSYVCEQKPLLQKNRKLSRASSQSCQRRLGRARKYSERKTQGNRGTTGASLSERVADTAAQQGNRVREDSGGEGSTRKERTGKWSSRRGASEKTETQDTWTHSAYSLAKV